MLKIAQETQKYPCVFLVIRCGVDLGTQKRETEIDENSPNNKIKNSLGRHTFKHNFQKIYCTDAWYLAVMQLFSKLLITSASEEAVQYLMLMLQNIRLQLQHWRKMIHWLCNYEMYKSKM